MAGAYTDAELQQLEDMGEKRRAVATTDICQMHISEFGGGR